MKLNKEIRKTTRHLFQASFTGTHLDESKVRGMVQQIVAGKPRNYFALLKNYQRFLRLEIEKHHAIIESATPLSPETGERVWRDLQAKYGEDLTVEFQVQPSLLGGLRIRIGSDVWDGSVLGRMTRLEQAITTN